MSYKILIVDDSKLARMAIAKALRTLCPDWTRIEATNADEAVAIVDRDGIDLVLVDFNMPGRNGLVLAEEFRDRKPTMPVAVISANSQLEVVRSAEAVGATFLPKPVTEQTLGDFLKEATKRLRAISP